MGLSTIRKARAKSLLTQTLNTPLGTPLPIKPEAAVVPPASPSGTSQSTEDLQETLAKVIAEDKSLLSSEFKPGEIRLVEPKQEDAKPTNNRTTFYNLKEKVNSATKKIMEKAEQVWRIVDWYNKLKESKFIYADKYKEVKKQREVTLKEKEGSSSKATHTPPLTASPTPLTPNMQSAPPTPTGHHINPSHHPSLSLHGGTNIRSSLDLTTPISKHHVFW